MKHLLTFIVTACALWLSGCAHTTTTTAVSSSGAAPNAKARTIYVAAVETKGGTSVKSEPFPTEALPGGGGYLLRNPDATGRWEVSTYRWDPGTIVVNQGERITFEIIGINGDDHPFTIEGYQIAGVVRRGKITRVSFTADKPGMFKIICHKHGPSMQGELVVLKAN